MMSSRKAVHLCIGRSLKCMRLKGSVHDEFKKDRAYMHKTVLRDASASKDLRMTISRKTMSYAEGLSYMMLVLQKDLRKMSSIKTAYVHKTVVQGACGKRSAHDEFNKDRAYVHHTVLQDACAL